MNDSSFEHTILVKPDPNFGFGSPGFDDGFVGSALTKEDDLTSECNFNLNWW